MSEKKLCVCCVASGRLGHSADSMAVQLWPSYIQDAETATWFAVGHKDPLLQRRAAEFLFESVFAGRAIVGFVTRTPDAEEGKKPAGLLSFKTYLEEGDYITEIKALWGADSDQLLEMLMLFWQSPFFQGRHLWVKPGALPPFPGRDEQMERLGFDVASDGTLRKTLRVATDGLPPLEPCRQSKRAKPSE